LTQNNDSTVYQPAGPHARGVHIALMGDPTLRMHRALPPGRIEGTLSSDGVSVTWEASAQEQARYHVYRAASVLGPYTRLTQEPLVACEYRDREGSVDVVYMVRTIALQQSPTGSYEIMSQGVMAHAARGEGK
jgi:hypothetical protein